MTTFREYYSNFLSHDPKHTFNKSKRRSEIFSFYWKMPVMVTDYYGDLVYSIAPDIEAEFSKYFSTKSFSKINSKLQLTIDEWFSRYSWNYRVNNYLRYCLDKPTDEIKKSKASARIMTIEDKDLALKGISNRSNGYKEAVWQNYHLPLINKSHIFIVEKDGEKASQATITNIDNQGANLMVVTDSRFQKQGYGKAAVALAVDWCLTNNLLPCYFHEESNIASQKLAESLGFKLQCKECDLFIHKSEKY